MRKGTALCRTSTNGQLKQFVAGGTVITAADPVFLVGWDGDTATVQVAQGYVRLENDRGTAVVGQPAGPERLGRDRHRPVGAVVDPRRPDP